MNFPIVVLYAETACHNLGISLFVTNFFSMYKLYCVVWYTVLIYGGMIFILFVYFYFTPHITTKHNNNNGMRHDNVWVDSTIDCMIFPLELDRLGR